MRFEAFSSGGLLGDPPDGVKITLTPQDMRSLGITYLQMDDQDPRTRAVLGRLLRLAQEKTGFCCPDHGRLLVELSAQPIGGCTLCLSIAGTGYGGQIYHFDRLSLLTQAAVLCLRQGVCPCPQGCRCSLYRFGEGYRIHCQPDNPAGQVGCRPILLEYGRGVRGPLAAACTEEHGLLLRTPDGLLKLAQSLG